MRMYDLIMKKRNCGILSKEEINFIVKGYVEGIIPDYQVSAFLMAVYFKGMNKEETSNLTGAFINSGDIIDLSPIKGIKVDKHSTGGVGDKISLIVIPLVASLGIPIAKMSGRGLGHTGGTIDKLESIKGFKTQMDINEFINNVNTYKMAIVGQTANLTPADKKIYALRDVTATVDSIPLIASSIMSKKIASGSDAIVLDVKVGSGAFMKNLDEAKELAQTMVDIGKTLKRKVVAVITNMDQPLGHEVGNANEVKEAIEVLKNNGAEDERVVALTIASYMAVLGGAYKDFDEAFVNLERKIESGEAIDKLKEFIRIQGGDEEIVDNPDKLPQAKYHIEIKAQSSGYVNEINAEKIGNAAMLLGAGRKTKEDLIDYGAGISLVKKIGDSIKTGDVIAILHTDKKENQVAKILVDDAYKISKNQPTKLKYVYDVIM
ncbi:MAG: pyrimidine-nucleoside phosphorylase [Epulopiscium sp.]|jgi:pyrimidine-nucleoside phosphorylase|nr:pyrimidine-nucleoside phosphorylase [Candidatus Epulonipiscium sp.]